MTGRQGLRAPSTRRLPWNLRRSLRLLADCERPHDPYGVVTSSATGKYDGQAWIHWTTVRALQFRGLVDVEYLGDRESGDRVRLTDAGRAALEGGSDVG